MRLLILLVVIAFVALGVMLGALNADLVVYDFGIASVSLPKGAALLAALLVGWLLGGLTAWLGRFRRPARGKRSSRVSGEASRAP
ncbi:hypothetical protein ATSB10_11200 [Dyella thiooxydans]|uniref:Lipopolysaccharide assembly protein A domain-containing protein n=1 Tax=Dyella thiooxydans TaxID=445710 RepID=A0A160MZK1_9GAMM|nr:hypothetical protein [Dyella thiooxydans]AND68574.1 hypothetical protein ATSB10_11200 [Dyella thiooxydans]